MQEPGLGGPNAGRTNRHSSWLQVWPSTRMLSVKICLGGSQKAPRLDVCREETHWRAFEPGRESSSRTGSPSVLLMVTSVKADVTLATSS